MNDDLLEYFIPEPAMLHHVDPRKPLCNKGPNKFKLALERAMAMNFAKKAGLELITPEQKASMQEAQRSTGNQRALGGQAQTLQRMNVGVPPQQQGQPTLGRPNQL